MIANINYVREILNRNELHAKKKFGQNFLIDANIVDNIARQAVDNGTGGFESNKDRQFRTIEIGPGLGSLTEMLLKYTDKVDAYEIDEDMYNILKEEFGDKINLYLQDFLDVDLSKYSNEDIYICSNLPYYVTTPILFKLINSNLNIKKMTVMVQKEVANRFNAKPNTKEYGSLSIICQYLYDVKLLLNAKRTVFYPSPDVDSAVITFTPKRNRDFKYEERLFKLIEDCFRKRRKTLNNNLKDIYNEEIINKIYDECKFDKNVRCEQLTIDDFIKMEKVINEG